MATRVTLFSERKGSNPGGYCSVVTPQIEFAGYLKYCPGSRLPQDSVFRDVPQPFRGPNQPIYEAVTLVLARRMKLITPDFYVLRNNDQLVFAYEHPGIPKINEEMPSYFVSTVTQIPPSAESKAKDARMAREKLYRDMLLVSDVSHKAQNYRYDEETDRMIYIDLGCSFVNAVNGYLNPTAGKLPEVTPRDRRRLERLKRETGLVTADGNDVVMLEDLLSVDHNTRIPTLNPRGEIRLGDLVSREEIEEIMELIDLSLHEVLRKNKQDPRLIR